MSDCPSCSAEKKSAIIVLRDAVIAQLIQNGHKAVKSTNNDGSLFVDDIFFLDPVSAGTAFGISVRE